MYNTMQPFAPPPRLGTYLRIGGKIGAFAGLGAAFVYLLFAGLLLSILADLVIPVLGWIEDILYVIAVAICSGIGGMLGMCCGFLIWCLATSAYKRSHP